MPPVSAKSVSTSARRARVDVSIVMPCLNEVLSLGPCIVMASEALRILEDRHGLMGEIVVADNGSVDGSQTLASRLGARVVDVHSPGYGAALIGGFTAAKGRYLVMGDSDGSYNFVECVPMVEKLLAGADLCTGSRFQGGIAPGAMPWKNRYIGNPVLTGILNILFRAGIDDAHCGLRAVTRSAFNRLRLTGSGMEFASEMLIKAALLGLRIAEVPATLSPDLRGRAPHLRPWRDGWRHLRYLFMLSPIWLFIVPAFAIALASAAVFASASLEWFGTTPAGGFFGNYWTILAGAGLTLSHIALIMGVTAQFHSVRSGYRRPGPTTSRLARWLSLETMLIAGICTVAAGMAILAGITFYWSSQGFEPIRSVFPAVIGTSLMIVGVQNMLGGFLLAIVLGHDAAFLRNCASMQDQKAEPDLRPLQVQNRRVG